MSSHKKDLLRKYAILLIAFMFSLLIPFLLYSLKINPLYGSNLSKPYEYPAMVKYSYSWPNTSSFNDSISSSDNVLQEKYKEIDQKYCGRDRCKFLLPVAITEQESKAQSHFRQLAFLAGKIDRTIILPNVYNSHLGACLAHPFDFYFDLTWLDNNKDSFNYITMDKFKEWISERHYAGVVPTGQEIYIQRSLKSRLLKNIKNCFQGSLDYFGRPTVNYHVADPSHQPRDMDLTKIMTSLLSDEARAHEYLGSSSNGAENTYNYNSVDVINLYYDRRYNIVNDPKAHQPISYNKRWEDIADRISSELKPYIAVHWRMERLEPVSNLLPCAQGLIDEIHKLDPESEQQQQQGSERKHLNVFLLTDYPHLLNTTGARPESASFYPSQLRREHHDAIHYLYTHSNVSLTTINDEQIHYDQLPKDNWHLLPIDTEGNTKPTDRSVLGIIDKLVAIKAQWFLAGRPGVCAKSSSFTGRISQSRSKAFRAGNEDIIVPLKTFDRRKD